jgi:hypothetical protein
MTHGGQHENTFEKTAEHCTGRLETQGCWSVKMRRKVGVKVACYLTSASKNPSYTRDKHFVMCAHGRKTPAGNSRKSALNLAKKSHEWCNQCEKAHKALTETEN